MINGILEYSDIFQSDFKSDIEKYRDIFIIYLKSRFEQNFLDISYVPDTKQDTVEKFWGDGNFANIWLTFQDIVTKYQTPYFFNVAKDYLKGSIYRRWFRFII
jgi:hypothetical protein